MTNTRLFTLITLIALLPLRLIAQIDMQAHVGSDEGKAAYKIYTDKQTTYYTGTYAYSSLISLTNDALFGSINTLMGNTNKITQGGFSYGALRYAYVNVDYDLNNKSNIICYYDGNSMSGDWGDGQQFNREHVWPQSFGASSTQPMGYDMHSVRPCLPSTNSSRNAKGYGETIGANIYDPDQSTNKDYSNYKPQNLGSYRGDAARMIMYDYLVYGQAGSHKNTLYNGKAQLLQSFGTSNEKIFESLHIMLKWHMQDPPSLTEMVRNDGAQDYQGNRNPLIDYPELAIQVFLDDGITTYTVTESSAATMWPAHRYTLSNGFIAYLTNSDGTHPAESDFKVTGATYTYNASLGRLTVSKVTGNMTISDVAGNTPDPNPDPEPDPTTFTVTWMANGAVHATDTYNGTQTISVPAAPTPCAGYTFVGWTTEANYSNPFCQPADLFIKADGKVTSNVTYYAVFKKQ